MRGHAGVPAHVLVIATLGAPERRLLRRRRRSQEAAPSPGPEPVSTARVTVVDPDALPGPDEATAWLAGADVEAELQTGLDVLGAAVYAHRIAAADPAARTPRREQALVCRIGYGAGEQVADGRWVRAITVAAPAERRRRAQTLGSQERFGALLSGRDAALAAETLALDTRRELDASRPREAALILRGALDAGLAELEAWRDRADLADRLAALAAARPAVEEAAAAALRGGLSDEELAAVTGALHTLQSALRARAAAAGGLL